MSCDILENVLILILSELLESTGGLLIKFLNGFFHTFSILPTKGKILSNYVTILKLPILVLLNIAKVGC